MINSRKLSHAVLLIGLSLAAPVSAGETLGRPPADPPGTVAPTMTPDRVQKAMDEQLRAKFEAAAGPSNNILTAAQARDAGWGFVVDRFGRIDRDGNGFVTFAEVQTFFDARSPIKQQRAKAAAAKAVQVVD